MPDIKAGAGDREGSGAHEGSPVALRVREGLQARGRWEMGDGRSQRWREWNNRVAARDARGGRWSPPAMSPAAGGPLPLRVPRLAAGRRAPRPAEGRAARLVLQRLLLEEAVET